VILAGLFIMPQLEMGGRARAYYDSLFLRLRSLFSPVDTLQSESLEWRKVEIEYAITNIVKHPLVGMGLGSDYRPRITWMDGYRDTRDWNSMSYIHNGYLFMLVDMGLLGLVPFLWFFYRFLARAFARWRSVRVPRDRAVAIGFTLGVVAILLSAMVSPRFFEWPGILVLATITGITEAIFQLDEQVVIATSEDARQ